MRKYILALPFCIALILLPHIIITEWIVSFFPYLIIFYFIGFIALSVLIYRTQKKLIAIAAIPLFLMILIFTGFYSPSILPTQKSEGQTFSVWFGNLLYLNLETDEIYETIIAKDPSVIVLAEYTIYHNEELYDKLSVDYPFNSFDDSFCQDIFYNRFNAGNVVFSKYPVNLLQSDNNGYGNYYSKFFSLDLNGEEILFGIAHTTSPVTQGNFQRRNAQLQSIHEVIAELDPERFFLVGDLNITPWSPHYWEFSLKNYFAASLKNDSRSMQSLYTWNSHTRYLLFNHIDHVFSTPALGLVEIESSDIPGSDHNSLYFEYTYD